MSITIEINSKTIEVGPNQTIFDCAERLEIRVPTSCNKQGKCRECLVEVEEGMALLSARAPQEGHLKDKFRLSCRTTFVSNRGQVRCHTLRRGNLKIESSAVGLPLSSHQLTPDPAVTRDGERILLEGVEIARGAGPLYGVAVDLGTTTVVARLVNLESGKVEATQSFENPQRFGGSDVMARIKFDTDNKGRLLQRTLLGYLSHAIEAFPCDPKNIYEMIIAGNTTMREIFFGHDVYSVGQKPYRSVAEQEFRDGKRETTSISVKAKTLRLPICPQGRVYGLPLIGSHVGADTTAGILAIDLAHEDKMVAMMDIGTNTELILGNRHKIFAASCPAGPAFEGGAISCGMPALDGAVERVEIKPDGAVKLRVVGNVRPEGICGSGLIDALGELLRTGRMNGLGRFENGEGKFVLDREHNIFLDESDVSQLAQAKGANVAGLHLVFKAYGVDFGELDRFYFAGGFARHIEVDAARRIGLIPDLPDEKIRQVGNASAEGATLALLSLSRRKELEALVKTITHVELETFPEFFDYFVEGCQFKPVQSTRLGALP